MESIRAAAAALALLLGATVPGVAPASAGEIGIVTSIAPVHSLVAGVTGDLATPHLIVRGTGSPHHYALRPSDAQALQEAQVVFWVGEGLETFLTGPIASLGRHAVSVELGEAPGIALLPLREGGAWESHDHDGDEAGHVDERAHGGSDPHIWLDPQNARTMVATIAQTMMEIDPSNASRYKANAAALSDRLTALDRELADALAPVRDRPFIVFHDGFQYLEERYGLAGAGSVTVNPERQPGAGRLGEIRDTIEARGAVCIFAEPQFEPRLVEVLVEGTGARTATLDPLGAALEPGPDLYFDLMRANAAALATCLSGGP